MSGNINFNGWLNDDGSENYKCRAWVNFNGTSTVAIRASGNVSSITDNAVGDYTVNFTTAMPDANYSFVGSCSPATAGDQDSMTLQFAASSSASIAPTTSTIRVIAVQALTAYRDPAYVSVAIFR